MSTRLERCSRCGSEKIMHGVPLLDSFGDVGVLQKQSNVSVHGNPEAWVFKDTASGKLSLDICGECGRAELQVSDFRRMWERAEKGGV